MVAWWLGLIGLFLVAGKAYEVLSRSLASVRWETERLSRELAMVSRRVTDLEDRLDLVGLPREASEVMAVRRVLDALALGLTNMLDEHDEANWWKQGGEEP